MGIPKKGSRIILIDGINYRYKITAHNDHIDLFVDADNKYYQLDNVVSENLYKFKGQNFYQMMRQLLGLDDEDNFEIIGRIKKSKSY